MKMVFRLRDSAPVRVHRAANAAIVMLALLAAATCLASCAEKSVATGASGIGASQSELALKQLDSDSSAAAEPWLVELNRLRDTGGMKPVSANSQLSADCVAHALYL